MSPELHLYTAATMNGGQAGVGPMMGPAMHFHRIAAPNGHDAPFATRRYVDESRRLLEVLDAQLGQHPYVAGDAYTIADVAMWPWARSYPWARVAVDGLEHLQAWFDRVGARPAVQRAIQLPRPVPAFFGDGDEQAEQRDNARRFEADAAGGSDG